MTAPRTAAGRALLGWNHNGAPLLPDEFRDRILAIEAEATPDRERLAAALDRFYGPRLNYRPRLAVDRGPWDADATAILAALAEGERT